MTSLRSLIGRDVVSRSSAETIGRLHDVIVDVPSRRVVAWQVGKGRKAKLVSHQHVTGIGDAAVVVDDEASLRAATGPLERATIQGHRRLLDARVLTEDGDEQGSVTDVEIDTASGALATITTSSATIGSERILGLGSYALVVAAS